MRYEIRVCLLVRVELWWCVISFARAFFSVLLFPQAECRLAARRQARAEAREIRMREIERQQREAEENADKMFDMHNAGEYHLSSTRCEGEGGGRLKMRG